MARQKRSARSHVWMTLKIALAFGLLGYAIATNREPIEEILARGADGRLFALAFGLYMAGVLLAFLRWFLLVRALGMPFRLRDAYRLGFIGMLFNFVIPGAVGGDFVKAAYLCREQGTRTGPIASIVVDRIVGLLGLFLLACAGGTYGWSTLDEPMRRLVTTAGIFTGATSLVLAIAFLPVKRPRTTKLGIELAAVGTSYRAHFGVILLGIGMACVTHTLNVVAFWTLGHVLFPSSVPGLAEHFLIVPLVLFSTAVPLPFGALGVSEQVSARLFRLTAYSGGAVAMMSFRLLQLGGSILGAGVYLKNQSQVRALRDEAETLDEALSEGGHPEPDGEPRNVPANATSS